MHELQIIAGVALALALAALLLRHVKKAHAKAEAAGAIMFRDILPTLADAKLRKGEAAGTWKVEGRYQGHPFQLQTVVDTLAVRKLPSLWLMITLPEAQPISGTVDLVMRPSGPSTFSNFDFLDHTFSTPAGFPERAVIRSDKPQPPLALATLTPHLALFHGSQGKELLVSPKGLRIVLQAAEGDRARYGVFRQAEFGDAALPPALVTEGMNTLLALAGDIRKNHGT